MAQTWLETLIGNECEKRKITASFQMFIYLWPMHTNMCIACFISCGKHTWRKQEPKIHLIENTVPFSLFSLLGFISEIKTPEHLASRFHHSPYLPFSIPSKTFRPDSILKVFFFDFFFNFSFFVLQKEWKKMKGLIRLTFPRSFHEVLPFSLWFFFFKIFYSNFIIEVILIGHSSNVRH